MPIAFEKQLLRMMQDPPKTVQDFATQFARNYDMNIALTCIPTPVTAGKQAVLAQALISAFQVPGAPPKAASGIVQGLSLFWLGVAVPGGAVTAFLGGPALLACLTSNLSNPKISANTAAARITRCLATATGQVQYLIPPGPPLFLVVPPP